MIELHVLSGSRTGASLKFEKPVVAVGRHATSDVRFDPQADLDVSTRHAEFRQRNGVWFIADEGSTNGTLLNGTRITGEHAVGDGDVVSFGANGPRVEVRTTTGPAPTPATRLSGSSGSSKDGGAPRLNTEVRVAHAVKAQTKSMRRSFALVVCLILVGGVAAFMWFDRKSSAHEAELNALIARGDSTTAALAKTIAGMRPSDSVVTRQLQEELDRRKKELANVRQLLAGGNATASSVADLARRMGPSSVGQMDVPRVSDLNDAAVAIIVSDLEGTPTGGTAFGVTPNGLLITNRHVVRTEAGLPAKRLAVMYANTNKWLRAHIVRVSDTDDLALLQIDGEGKWPVVAGVSKLGAVARVGAPVVSIGYPLSNETPMEGEGLNITARTTTIPGTVSKRLEDVLQIDSFSAHGASGSPLFDDTGNVVGVIYGGAKESNGRIVYAVPAQRLAAFLAADAAAILR